MPAVDLIASDLDRTFLGADKLPSAENLQAVRDATDAGVKMVFATGRPYRWLDVLEILAPVHPTVISANGAVSVDVATGEVLHQRGFDLDVLRGIVDDVRRVVPGALFCTEEARTWGVEPGFDRSFDKGLPDAEAPIEDLLAAGPQVVKFLVKAYGVPSDELYGMVAAVVGDRAVTTYSFQGPDGILEISAPGVTKGAALAQVCQDLDVDPARAAAFGDMPNDVSMLDLVGHPFVVSNGHPDLLTRGYTVVGHHDDSAVGRTIQQLLAVDGHPSPMRSPLSGAH
ncbi:HAD hydrolase family protein [Acidipropionibacterium virtanenii]|uniref:Phosphatase YwpJ n=1 Tax=Acidipropionibacterium virtanenii TaxID=2057246 RepID=A0A344UUQ8_9ACTN|nr:HAD hydrolase family protein [Acidipropionibacterium virtanenii]AXE39006.1 Phosphatase YwpJ [Acidipropionibacterium virtanenii]